MTTCREAKQGMRRDQDCWDGVSEDYMIREPGGLGLGLSLPFVLPRWPGLGTALDGK